MKQFIHKNMEKILILTAFLLIAVNLGKIFTMLMVAVVLASIAYYLIKAWRKTK